LAEVGPSGGEISARGVENAERAWRSGGRSEPQSPHSKRRAGDWPGRCSDFTESVHLNEVDGGTGDRFCRRQRSGAGCQRNNAACASAKGRGTCQFGIDAGCGRLPISRHGVQSAIRADGKGSNPTSIVFAAGSRRRNKNKVTVGEGGAAKRGRARRHRSADLERAIVATMPPAPVNHHSFSKRARRLVKLSGHTPCAGRLPTPTRYRLAPVSRRG